MKDNKYELIAHRGFAGINIENTISALTSALQLGADSIEFDIQTSIEGTPYLFHDLIVDYKTNGNGIFTSLNNDTINNLKITLLNNKEDIIPLMKKAINIIKKFDFKYIYPEIKSYNNQNKDIKNMVDIVKCAGLSNKTIWLSFNISDLQLINQLDSNLKVRLLLSNGSYTKNDIKKIIDNITNNLNNGGLFANYKLFVKYPEIIKYAKNKGIEVGTWTVNDRKTINHLIDIGVRKIISDYNIKI